MASFISTSIYFLICYIFSLKKFKLNALDKKYLKVLLIGILAYLPSHFLAKFDFFLVDIIIRSTITSIIFIFLIYYSKILEEINNKIDKLSDFIKK